MANLPSAPIIDWLARSLKEDSPMGELARAVVSNSIAHQITINTLQKFLFFICRHHYSKTNIRLAYQAYQDMIGDYPHRPEHAKQFLEDALFLFPDLTPAGLSEWGDESFETRPYLNEIALCADWLRRQTYTKYATRQSSSYTYKHRVEELTGVYIPNGCIIAAAVGLGIRTIRCGWKDPNAHLGLSKVSSIKYEQGF